MAPNSAKPAAVEYRYERKFFVTDLDRHEVESLVRLHPAMFRRPFPPRHINNVYFDSKDTKSYTDNVIGIADRVKVRVRWYGDLYGEVNKPTLEIKVKRGLVGHKKSFRLPPFTFDRGLDRDRMAALFARAEVPEPLAFALSSLDPTLVNRYRRQYFLSADGRVRLTLDNDLEFFRAHPRNNTFLSHHRDSLATVLELKYDTESEARASQISARFPFRMTRSSKYVQGLDWVALW